MSARLPVTSLAYALHSAAGVVAGVLAGRSLAEGALARVAGEARPAVQDLVYSTLRAYGRGDFILARILDRPLGEADIRALLLLALQRLELRPEAAHTIVDQAVEAAGHLAGGRLRGLVNGVLRNYLRRSGELSAAADGDDVARHCHPDWWLARLRAAYPEDWPAIVAAGNQPPPMALRVNRRRSDRDGYLKRLCEAGIDASPWPEGDDAILLARPVPVERLPGFGEGLVSVQDPGAQGAAKILAPAAGVRVLDACAAPGGKAAHLLEAGDVDLLALDLKAARCRRIDENLSRLGLSATVRVADCSRPASWWDGRPFDAVLADVPCTASGVVRRHPDAKWLRRDDDVASFARTQAGILDALWQVVAVGGKLLYATCSIFPEENTLQVARFMARYPNARKGFEQQLLPTDIHDGFYYCLLEKRV